MPAAVSIVPRIRAIAQSHLTDPVRVQIDAEPAIEGEAPKVRQDAYVVQRAYKPAALVRLLDAEEPADGRRQESGNHAGLRAALSHAVRKASISKGRSSW